MFRLTVRDHVMTAHSLRDPFFGPAQNLHGVTYVVEATWCAAELDEHGVVIDIGAATEALTATLEPLRYSNLDERPEFEGQLTTTEFLCRWIAERLALDSDERMRAVEVTLREHPDAWATYVLDLT